MNYDSLEDHQHLKKVHKKLFRTCRDMGIRRFKNALCRGRVYQTLTYKQLGAGLREVCPGINKREFGALVRDLDPTVSRKIPMMSLTELATTVPNGMRLPARRRGRRNGSPSFNGNNSNGDGSNGTRGGSPNGGGPGGYRRRTEDAFGHSLRGRYVMHLPPAPQPPQFSAGRELFGDYDRTMFRHDGDFNQFAEHSREFDDAVADAGLRAFPEDADGGEFDGPARELPQGPIRHKQAMCLNTRQVLCIVEGSAGSTLSFGGAGWPQLTVTAYEPYARRQVRVAVPMEAFQGMSQVLRYTPDDKMVQTLCATALLHESTQKLLFTSLSEIPPPPPPEMASTMSVTLGAVRTLVGADVELKSAKDKEDEWTNSSDRKKQSLAEVGQANEALKAAQVVIAGLEEELLKAHAEGDRISRIVGRVVAQAVWAQDSIDDPEGYIRKALRREGVEDRQQK